MHKAPFCDCCHRKESRISANCNQKQAPGQAGGYYRGSRHAQDYWANNFGHRNRLRACDFCRHARRCGALASAIVEGRSAQHEAGAHRGAGAGYRSDTGRVIERKAARRSRAYNTAMMPALVAGIRVLGTSRRSRLLRSGAQPTPRVRRPRCRTRSRPGWSARQCGCRRPGSGSAGRHWSPA